MTTRPMSRAPQPAPGRRKAVNPEALRWLLIGFLAGKGETAREFAARTGIPQQRVSDVRTGARCPADDDLLVLLDEFGVRPREVLTAVAPAA